MDTETTPPGRRISSRLALRRFAVASEPGPAAPEERCELCGARLAPRHRHLYEAERRNVACACDACALRFEGVIGGRFALIPRDARRLPDFQLPDEQWADFSLPIDLAFFFHRTADHKVVAMYPGPAGAVESLLTLPAWNRLVEANPALSELAPDVEALLVDRRGTARSHYVAPIDACYELVGLIRRQWRGLSGGSEVWKEIDRFFQQLAPASALSSSVSSLSSASSSAPFPSAPITSTSVSAPAISAPLEFFHA